MSLGPGMFRGHEKSPIHSGLPLYLLGFDTRYTRHLLLDSGQFPEELQDSIVIARRGKT